jgi:hypothetical protein
MIPSYPLGRFRGFILPLGVGIVAALVLLASVSVRSAQNPAPLKNEEVPPPAAAVKNEAAPPPSNPKGESKNPNLEKTKIDAAELSALADQLRDELKKMNANVLSLDIIDKTQKVEKLAKKIKGEAYGY